jgi:hypothetical protein
MNVTHILAKTTECARNQERMTQYCLVNTIANVLTDILVQIAMKTLTNAIPIPVKIVVSVPKATLVCIIVNAESDIKARTVKSILMNALSNLVILTQSVRIPVQMYR